MARSEARILVEIWDDPDFVALSPTEQRLFLFLLSQRDLEHTGVLALRERRWAKGAAGLASSQVTDDLERLELARFIVLDEDAGEVFIRSFIRRDKVFLQPNVMRNAADRMAMITSQRIRDALAVELMRIAQTEPMGEKSAALVSRMRDELEKGSGNPCRNPSDMGSDEGSVNPTGNPSEDPSLKGSAEGSGMGTAKGSQLRPGEWGVVTTVTTDSPSSTPQASGAATDEPSQESSDDAESAAQEAKPTKGNAKEGKLPSTHPKLTWSTKEIEADPAWVEFWSAYPKKDDKGHARATWLKALRELGATAQGLIEGAQRYRGDPRRDPNFTKNPGTWLNGECWKDGATVEPSQPAGPQPFYNN